MRKFIVAVCFFFLGVVASAQDRPTSIYLFVTNPGFTHTHQSGTHWDGGVGAAVQHMFTPRLSGEISVTRNTRAIRPRA